jgi:hypothetical protein
MINPLKKTLIAVVITVAAIGLALPLVAAEKPVPSEAKKENQPKGTPFNGKVKAVDKAKHTITIDREKSNTFHVTPHTKIVKAGKPATFDDITIGEQVGGKAHEKDGKLEATSLRIGPKPAAEGAAKKEKKAEEKQNKKEAK